MGAQWPLADSRPRAACPHRESMRTLQVWFQWPTKPCLQDPTPPGSNLCGSRRLSWWSDHVNPRPIRPTPRTTRSLAPEFELANWQTLNRIVSEMWLWRAKCSSVTASGLWTGWCTRDHLHISIGIYPWSSYRLFSVKRNCLNRLFFHHLIPISSNISDHITYLTNRFALYSQVKGLHSRQLRHLSGRGYVALRVRRWWCFWWLNWCWRFLVSQFCSGDNIMFFLIKSESMFFSSRSMTSPEPVAPLKRALHHSVLSPPAARSCNGIKLSKRRSLTWVCLRMGYTAKYSFPTSLCGVLVFGCALPPAAICCSFLLRLLLPPPASLHTTCSHTTYSHTTCSHTHNLSTHNLLTHNLFTQHLSIHNLSTHNLSTHNLLTHNLFTHNLSTHNLFTQSLSSLPTHNLLTHNLLTHTTCPHTTCSHTTCSRTICPHTACSHTTDSHTTCSHTVSPHTTYSHTICPHNAAVFCVAGVALGDIQSHLAWHLWHAWSALVAGDAAVDAAAALRGRRGTWWLSVVPGRLIIILTGRQYPDCICIK